MIGKYFEYYQNTRAYDYSFLFNDTRCICFAPFRYKVLDKIKIHLAYVKKDKSDNIVSPVTKDDVKMWLRLLNRSFVHAKYKYNEKTHSVVIKFDETQHSNQQLFYCTLVRPLFESQYVKTLFEVYSREQNKKKITMKDICGENSIFQTKYREGHSIFVPPAIASSIIKKKVSISSLLAYCEKIESQTNCMLNDIFKEELDVSSIKQIKPKKKCKKQILTRF